MGTEGERRETQAFIDQRSWITALDVTPDEAEDLASIIQHTVFGLAAEGLIAQAFASGDEEGLRGFRALEWPASGLTYQVTPTGIELFVRAHGKKGDPIDLFDE